MQTEISAIEKLKQEISENEEMLRKLRAKNYRVRELEGNTIQLIIIINVNNEKRIRQLENLQEKLEKKLARLEGVKYKKKRAEILEFVPYWRYDPDPEPAA